MFVYYKCYISIELTFLQEWMLIKQEHQQIFIFFTTAFLKLQFQFQPNAFNRFHDLLIMSMNFSDIAILNIKHSDYDYIISLIRKDDDIKLMENADLTKKSRTL